MTRRVLDVGNCGPDHGAIRRMLRSHFQVEVLQTDQWADSLKLLETQTVDLILVNRKLDCDYSDGIEIIRQLKQDPRFQQIPVMLITNYEDHQRQAETLGAVWGFGKLQLDHPSTIERLRPFLESQRA